MLKKKMGSALSRLARVSAMIVLTIGALVCLGATVASALGMLPWLPVALSIEGYAIPWAGMAFQILGTLTVLSLVVLLPSHARILELERSHRNFQIGMDDIAQAYHVCHAADRAGVFTKSHEFDAVKERVLHLRAHPDLGRLETDVLEAAAQMSVKSRALAEIYSQENVARADAFLEQRQTEIESHEALVAKAQRVNSAYSDWIAELELSEIRVEGRLLEIVDRLRTVFQPLGYDIAPSSDRVVQINRAFPAE
ncbi:MAG: DNA repair protein [Pseudomonadota bacterium]